MERLKDKADTGCAHRCATIFVEISQVVAVEPYFSFGWRIESGQEREQCGLAGSGRTNNGYRITVIDRETDLGKDGQSTFGAANLFGDIVRGKNRFLTG